jgi:tRNA(adenine34) deaminase
MNTEKDEDYMKMALEEAKKAYAINEVPIGAVIVYRDQIIGRGYNRRNTDKSTLAHAEILAMEEAMAFIGDWRLEETTMYITLEPCPMCAGAIVQARIPRVVLGAMNPKAGSAGSVVNLLNEPKFNHQVQVEYDVCHDACKAILQDFFKELREQKKGLR